MENYITRYANEKGYSTRECYKPIRITEVPDQFKHKYATYDEYIDALAESVKEYQNANGKPDFLLMSYHGIPKRYFDKGDKQTFYKI